MASPFHMVSGDAQRALEEFSTSFMTALSAVDPAELWASQLGLSYSSRAIRTTYPLSISAAGYKEHVGDIPMRRLYTRSLDVEPIEWVDGVTEKASIIEAPDFIGWGEEPANIAREARRLPNILVSDLLITNPNLGLYRDRRLNIDAGIPLFSGSHPVNIFDSSFGVFDNDHTGGGFNAETFAGIFTRFRARPGANGRPLGLRFSHLLVSAGKEQDARAFLQSDMLREAFLAGGSNTNELTNNRFKNVVQLVVADELPADHDYMYPIASNGPKPWIVQDGGAPEEIRYDKDSDHYKSTFEVGVKYKLMMSAVAALPHGIERIQFA